MLTLGTIGKFQSNNKSFSAGLLRANTKVSVKDCVIIKAVFSGAGKTLNRHVFFWYNSAIAHRQTVFLGASLGKMVENRNRIIRAFTALYQDVCGL